MIAGYRAKRPFDLVLAAVVAVPVAALSLVVAGLVLIRLGRPVFFVQQRPGMNGRPFGIWKFRSMRTGPGPDAERLDGFGRWLRSTSLDELPSWWNVIRGEMSFVGPRPLLMEYLPRYSPEEARRMLVRPGITGWAQVHGRNTVGWPERLALDVWYVDHASLALDLKILAMTIPAVFRRTGIAAPGEATMSKFEGRGG